MRILVTGRNGQVGRELCAAFENEEKIALDRSALDLREPDSIVHAVREARADVIVNAGAYTAVDQAESEPEIAAAVNARAPAVLAEEAQRSGALLVHYSTDYVFDGEKRSPYAETDLPKPLNEYGRSKLAGEEAIRASGCRHLILRTSWVYAATGKNFLRTILRLAGEDRPLRVVDDQTGAPTTAAIIARATRRAVSKVSSDRSLEGLYHLSAQGATTWYGFARAICDAAKPGARIVAISSSEYPTAARRPRNSLLDNSKIGARLGVRLPPWEEALRETMALVGRL